jgi:WD40 repeat protein
MFGLALGGFSAGWCAMNGMRGTAKALAGTEGAVVKLTKELDLATRGAANGVAWSPDGSALAAASWYGEDLAVWDRFGSVLSKFKRIGGGPFPENSLAFLRGSSELLFPPPETTDNAACVAVWDVTTGRIVKTVPGPAPEANDYARNRARHFVVSNDQIFAAAAPTVGGAVAIYETKSWRQTGTLKIDYGVGSLAFFPDGRRLAVGALTKGHFLVIDTDSAQIIADFAPYANKYANIGIGAITVSADAQLILTGIGLVSIPGEYYRVPEARTWDQLVPPAVSVWRVSDGSFVAGFAAARYPIRQAAWDPKGRFVAFVDNAATLFIWNPLASQESVIKISLSKLALSLAITSNGDRLAVTDSDGVKTYRID